MTLARFDFRNNGIGFLRLCFAGIVVWMHAYGVGGFGSDPIIAAGSALSSGFLAVAGFFVLSGFLITRSFERVGNGGRFLWHRLLRIFPGYWMCLLLLRSSWHGSSSFTPRDKSGYLSEVPSPLSYIGRNAWLITGQETIGSVLQGLPEWRYLNGSLWTLQFEFGCYLSVLVLGILGALRWRLVSAVMLLVFYVATAVILTTHNGTNTLIIYVASELGVFFWMGACAYLFRDRIPVRGWLAALCAVATILALQTPGYAIIVMPCVAYVTIYVAMYLPIRSFDRKVDLSYGLYIYAYPLQQLLTAYGVNRYGFLAYLGASLGVSLLFAAASWFCIEHPFLRLKNIRLGFTQASERVERPG